MKEGKLYFLMRSDGLVKIGFTGDFRRRRHALTKSHGPLEVIRLINGDKHREKRLHQEFSESNEYGEWFRSSPDLLHRIANLDEGAAVDVAKGDINKYWIAGEAELAAEAVRLVERLIVVRRQRTGCKNGPAIDGICSDYQIRKWTFHNYQMKRPSTVTAFTLKVLRDALVSELSAHRDELLADIAAVEADEPVASRIQAKRAARAAR